MAPAADPPALPASITLPAWASRTRSVLLAATILLIGAAFYLSILIVQRQQALAGQHGSLEHPEQRPAGQQFVGALGPHAGDVLGRAAAEAFGLPAFQRLGVGGAHAKLHHVKGGGGHGGHIGDAIKG